MALNGKRRPGRRGRPQLCRAIAAGLAITAAAARAARAQDSTIAAAAGSGSARWNPALLGAQMNFIRQRLFPFHAQYSGLNSLQSDGDAKTSEAYGVYAGMHIERGLEGYLDIEMVRGKGISRTVGLAGITNGDVIRQGSADLGDGPYVARAFLRYAIGFGSRLDTLSRDIDQLPEVASARRLVITAGKFALSDLFDLNRYANSTRTQFMNWGLFQNTAWDYAADTRGYSNGAAVEWIQPEWSMRAAAMQMPLKANGNVFDSDLRRAHGFDAEVEGHVLATSTAVRVLGYLNEARMGLYASVLGSRAAVTVPDIASDDTPGRFKYGWGVNVEQPLADGGDTGAFLRFGWSDGAAESFAFTESDRHFSGGIQLSGSHWSRPADRLGFATVLDGIVKVHQEYLARGGDGFLLGDGALDYGEEQVVEAYYRIRCGANIEISPDVQYIRNPGYNRDRGPATVASLRLNVRY